MAMGRQEIDLVVNALVKGFDALESDLNQTGESFGKLALKQQLAADKSSLFDQQMRELTKAVADGKITMQDAANRAEDLAKKLQLGGEAVQKQKLSWTDLKSALDLAKQGFEIVAKAAEFAYTNIKEGAQLELARNQFDNLTASIGTTSDSMLNDLRAATKGMQSDAELIAGATDIISLGLSDTQEGTVRLATAVSTLGLDMQQVILTFANNSKARLDALGLSIEDVDAKTRELEANGFKGDAFDEAVLLALEEKMTLLGDASETTAGQLQILESNWANLANAAKEGAAALAAPVVANLAGDVQTQKQLTAAYKDGIITYRQWLDASRASRGEGGLTAEQFKILGIAVNEYGEIVDHASARAAEMSEFYKAQAAAAGEATQETINYSAALAATRGPNEELNDKLAQTANLLSEEDAALIRAQAEVDALSEAAIANSEAMALMNPKIEEAASQTDRVVGSTERASDHLHRLAEAGHAAASGMYVIIPAADGVTAAVDRSSIALDKLLGYMNSLDGRSVTASVSVTVDDAAARLGAFQNMGGSGGGKGGSYGDKSGGTSSSYSGSSSGADPTKAGGGSGANYVIQNNTFNNAVNPNAIATQTAEKLGQAK